MKWIMKSSFGLSHCDVSPSIIFKPLTPEELISIRRIYPSLRSIAGHPVTPYTNLEAVFHCIDYFTFLRDPIQQCASYFQYLTIALKRCSKSDFETWIHTDWPRNMQTKRLCSCADAQKAIEIIIDKNIFIGLTERFDESLLLLKTLRASDMYLGYHARNEASTNIIVKELLSDKRTYNLIEDAVKEDIKLYGWVKHDLYPQYIKAYAEKMGRQIPDAFSFGRQNFRAGYVFTSRLYRNLVYKPFFYFHRVVNSRRKKG